MCGLKVWFLRAAANCQKKTSNIKQNARVVCARRNTFNRLLVPPEPSTYGAVFYSVLSPLPSRKVAPLATAATISAQGE